MTRTKLVKGRMAVILTVANSDIENAKKCFPEGEVITEAEKEYNAYVVLRVAQIQECPFALSARRQPTTLIPESRLLSLVGFLLPMKNASPRKSYGT